MNTEAMKMSARAAWETGREGNGLTSCSDPEGSVSSCQPGNVASKMKHMNARMTATILYQDISTPDYRRKDETGTVSCLHEIRENNSIFESRCNPDEIQRILI